MWCRKSFVVCSRGKSSGGPDAKGVGEAPGGLEAEDV